MRPNPCDVQTVLNGCRLAGITPQLGQVSKNGAITQAPEQPDYVAIEAIRQGGMTLRQLFAGIWDQQPIPDSGGMIPGMGRGGGLMPLLLIGGGVALLVWVARR